MPVYCTKCGAGWAAGEKFCRKCGHRLSSGDLIAKPTVETTAEIRRGVETTVLRGVAAERFEGSTPFETEPTLPMYQPGQREVGSKPPGPAGRSRKVAKALNIAVGIVIVGLAAGLVVRYLGSGRPTMSVASPPTEEPVRAPEQAPPQPELPAAQLPEPTSVDQALQKVKDKDTQGSAAKEQEVAKAAAEMPLDPAGSKPEPKAETKPGESKPPANVDHVKRGLELYSSGSYSQAVAEFHAAGRLQPTNGDVHYLTAMAYEKMGRPADALAEYEKCKSGNYAPLAAQHVKRLSKRLNK